MICTVTKRAPVAVRAFVIMSGVRDPRGTYIVALSFKHDKVLTRTMYQ